MSSGIQEYSDNLIYWTKSLQEPDAKPDVRALALAYYEVSQLYPAFRQRGFALLEQAAQELPGDAEIQATYGLVMTLAHPESTEDASRALQKAIDSGSKSVEVRTHLAKIRLKERNAAAALHLYKEAIEADPYYTPAYFGLAQLYAVTQDRQSAAETLKKVLKYDPGNEEARRALADTRDNSSQ